MTSFCGATVIQFVSIAAAVFFFVVKPLAGLLSRTRSPAEEEVPEEERRHQETLAALERLAVTR